MSGIHHVVLTAQAPAVVANYAATISIGYQFIGGRHIYGVYVPEPDPIGSVSESGGTMEYLTVESANADFSNPTTTMFIGGLGALSTTTVTVGGISRSDGYTSSGSDGSWSWPGDVFAIRSKWQQTVSMTVQGAG